ncbi:MAG: hypothetical protein AB7I30_19420 [Isosphaeraceae bacterium]
MNHLPIVLSPLGGLPPEVARNKVRRGVDAQLVPVPRVPDAGPYDWTRAAYRALGSDDLRLSEAKPR